MTINDKMMTMVISTRLIIIIVTTITQTIGQQCTKNKLLHQKFNNEHDKIVIVNKVITIGVSF